jgi:hypothetical protein
LKFIMFKRIEEKAISKINNLLPNIFSGTYLLIMLLLMLFFSGATSTASGQQMVVDDAGVTEFRAFQLEAWYGTEESWILPAFSPVRGLELAAGAAITEDETFAVTEAKYMFRAPAKNRAGFGLVAGALFAPFGEFYTYVPVTLPLFEERVVLHGNAGYMLERFEIDHGDHTHTHEDHFFTWGARADVALAGPVTLLGELFGANDETPDFQVGLRLEILPGLLEMDFTYGNNFSRESSGLGFTAGLAWTPPPFR